MIRLRNTGRYKDGGSTSYKDKSGNQYWLNRKIGSRGTSEYGVLYEGNINNRIKIKAVGLFSLDGLTIIRQLK